MNKAIKRVDSRQSTVGRKTLWLVFVLTAMIGQVQVTSGETKATTSKETPVKKESTKKELTVADVTQKVEEVQAVFQDAQMDLQMEMKDTVSGTQQNSKGAVKMKSPDKIFV